MTIREEAPAGAVEAPAQADDWFIFAYEIGPAGVRRIGEAELGAPPGEGGTWRWIHLDREEPRGQEWLTTASGIPELAAEALLDEATRPRLAEFDSGLVLFLRSVNLNPGADPEDMVTVRLWIEPRRVVSLRRRRVAAVDDVRLRCEKGQAPATPGKFVASLADLLVDRAEDVIDDMGATLERLERDRNSRSDRARQRALADLQRSIVPLRRYLSPQRDALNALAHLRGDLFSKRDRTLLKEANSHLSRMIEDLGSLSELAGILHAELTNNLNDELNRAAYTLSIVSAIFLPLTFVTGLMGMNVEGIPAAEHPFGFWLAALVCLAIGGLTVPILVALRRWQRRRTPRRRRSYWRIEADMPEERAPPAKPASPAKPPGG